MSSLVSSSSPWQSGQQAVAPEAAPEAIGAPGNRDTEGHTLWW